MSGVRFFVVLASKRRAFGSSGLQEYQTMDPRIIQKWTPVVGPLLDNKWNPRLFGVSGFQRMDA